MWWRRPPLSVYGLNPALPKSEHEWVRPLSPYAVTKLATEQYPLAYQQSYRHADAGVPLLQRLRPRQRAGHVYAAVIPTFIDALLRGEPLWINGDGSNSRDFTYVGTVCRVLLDACERRVSHPEPVNLAFGTSTTCSTSSPLSSTPPAVGRRAAPRPRPGDVPHSQADNAVLRSLFPEVTPVELPKDFASTLDWFKENS